MNPRQLRQIENDLYLTNRAPGSPVRRLPTVARLPARVAPREEGDNFEARAAFIMNAIDTGGTVKPRFAPITTDQAEGGNLGADDIIGALR